MINLPVLVILLVQLVLKITGLWSLVGRLQLQSLDEVAATSYASPDSNFNLFIIHSADIWCELSKRIISYALGDYFNFYSHYLRFKHWIQMSTINPSLSSCQLWGGSWP